VIVYHVAIDTSDDYLTRREAHRHAHIQRLTGLRAAGIVIACGPTPDGTRAELFYRLQQPSQLVNVIEEEFGVQIDMDVVPELVSFDRIHQYLQKAAG